MKTINHSTPGTALSAVRKQLHTAFIALILCLPGLTRAAGLSVALGEGQEGTVVSLPVTVSDPNGVAALAATLTYDTQSLDVRVRSTFFDTFANQYAATAVSQPATTAVIVGGVEYDRPLVVTPLPAGNGLAVAGVRRAPANGAANEPLLTLDVSLKPGATAGNYVIGLAPTVIAHTAAGYNPAGETLPVLVGRDLAAGTFPVILPAVGAALHLTPGEARFLATPWDSDGDGLSDAWELEQFGDLTTASSTSDTDGDGQPDSVECLMGTDANRADSIGKLTSQLDGDVYRVYFPIRTGHQMDFGIQHSPNMKIWSEEDVTLTERPELGSGSGWTTMEAAIPTNGAQHLFSRLRLTLGQP